MAAKGTKHILHAGATDKRALTATLWQSFDGLMLPFQLIYTGKTQRSFPNFKFPDGICLAFNQNHWSNETETVRLIEDVLVSYIEKVKEKKALPQSQKSLRNALLVITSLLLSWKLSKATLIEMSLPFKLTFGCQL